MIYWSSSAPAAACARGFWLPAPDFSRMLEDLGWPDGSKFAWVYGVPPARVTSWMRGGEDIPLAAWLVLTLLQLSNPTPGGSGRTHGWGLPTKPDASPSPYPSGPFAMTGPNVASRGYRERSVLFALSPVGHVQGRLDQHPRGLRLVSDLHHLSRALP